MRAGRWVVRRLSRHRVTRQRGECAALPSPQQTLPGNASTAPHPTSVQRRGTARPSHCNDSSSSAPEPASSAAALPATPMAIPASAAARAGASFTPSPTWATHTRCCRRRCLGSRRCRACHSGWAAGAGASAPRWYAATYGDRQRGARNGAASERWWCCVRQAALQRRRHQAPAAHRHKHYSLLLF